MNLFVKEELWAAVEAEVLDAAGKVDIAGEDAESFHSTYIAKVDDYLVRQRLHILAPSRVPIGLFIAINQTLCNTFTKFFSISKHNAPLVLVDDITALNKMNLFGAIIGKAYYTGAIKISDALEAVK